MPDGDDNEASDVGDTVHGDDPIDEYYLVIVFRLYTQQEMDEWHPFRDNFVVRMWEEYQSSKGHRTI